jgi:hypothetical protein
VILDEEHFELYPELMFSFAKDIVSGMTGNRRACD